MLVLAAQLNPTIGDFEGNCRKVLDALDRGRGAGAEVVLFPEMTLTGYSPDDLLLDPSFIDAVEAMLKRIAPATKGLFVTLGLPRKNPTREEKFLYNSAAIFIDGRLAGFQDKRLLPTYDVFDERRYFEPGLEQKIWEYKGKRIAVTICEDLWQHSGTVGYTKYRNDPVVELMTQAPDLLLNLSGSPYYYKRRDVRVPVFQAAAKALKCPLVFCNQVGANDQLVFDGYSFALCAMGELLQVAKGFVEDDLLVDIFATPTFCPIPETGTKDLYSALCLGVKDYFHKQGFKKALLGLSGGIDSALVASIAKDALGAKNVLAITMPSRYSSKGSVADSARLAHHLGIELRTIAIDSVFQNYLDLLEPHFQEKKSDETEENLQTRIRGMVLMAFANKFGHILLNTGNKSEMAMGYTTLYGDMAGGLGVLHDVLKTHVYELAAFVNRNGEVIPQAIIDKVPTAELRENQTDFDTLPKFEILDPIIADYIEERLSPDKIAAGRGVSLSFVIDLIHRMHLAEYKRRQAPIGIRVSRKAFGKGRIIPIVQKWC